MAYIGQNADGNFTTSVSKDTFSGNGSTTAFTLSEAATTNTVDVFVENIRQEPTTAYSVDGTTLTFTAAPVSGTDNIYVVNRGPIQLSASHPAAQSLSAFSATITNDLTVDTDTLFVDASADAVGIGTDSPISLLHTFNTATTTYSGSTGDSTTFRVQTRNNSSTNGQVASINMVSSGNNGGNNATVNLNCVQDSATSHAGSFTVQTRASSGTVAEAMRIDSSGNVGIGTSSPSSFFSDARQLVVGSGSGSQGITISSGTSENAQIFFADGTSGDAAYRGIVRYLHSSDAMAFYTSGANERMRIDSSGNVGIGTSPSVKLDIDNGSLKVNRGNSSGDIAVFRGLNAEKVKIDTDGIKFNGDTAAANALDDYEEGTWTPSIGTGTVNAQAARYVKIGQQVTVWGYLQTFSDRSSAVAINISGLPFTSASDNYASGATFHRYINANGDMVTAYIPVSTSTMTFYSSVKNSNYVNVLHSHLSSTSAVIFFTISYRA